MHSLQGDGNSVFKEHVTHVFNVVKTDLNDA